MIRFRRILPFALPLLAGTFLFGCEEDLTRPAPYQKPFTLYGVITPDLGMQSIRLYPIENLPTLGSASIDAHVASEDLTTGETHTWTDSAVVDPNGQYEHVFWSPFRAEYGHRYHVEATRPSDGASSSAEVQIPPQATIEVDYSQSPRIHVIVRGDAIRVVNPAVVYSVRLYGPNGDRSLITPILQYTISYDGQQQKTADGWDIEVKMDFDRPWLHSWYALDDSTFVGVSCPQLALENMQMSLVVGDTVWNPPGGTFDPNTLAHPGVMSNVENGFGFIGGGYRIQKGLDLSSFAIQKACFWAP